jgi:hypothetical protein
MAKVKKDVPRGAGITGPSRQGEADSQGAADPIPEGSYAASEVEVAPAPRVRSRRAAIRWRWGRAADMPALRVCHFQSEEMAGKELYLPDQSSDQRVIAVAEKDGKIVGGLFAEDSVVVTMVGLERSVAESAYDAVIPAILMLARNEGTRLVEIRLPGEVKFDLQTGVEPEREKPTQ